MFALRVGQDALLIECADAAEVRATYAALRSAAQDLGAVDIVPAGRTVLLDGLPDAEATLHQLAALDRVSPLEPDDQTGGLVELPTRYDGPDLDEVARQWQCTTAEVVQRHRATDFVVAFCGFAPGFAYCAGLPAEFEVSRRADPRSSVPPGSVALAGEYTGIYPTASPGGWQLIGSTPTRLWRPEARQPALLPPGTRVRFVDE